MKVEHSKLAIIIVNYQTPLDTVKLLKSLREEKGGGERIVYVVDSGSKDNSKDIIENELKENEIFISVEENLGYGYCNNVGIRKGLEWGADYFLILNPDLTLEQNLLKMLLIALEAQPKCGMACPVSISEDKNTIQSIGGEFSLWTGRAKRRFYGKRVNEIKEDFDYVDFPIGDAILFRREFFEDVGLMHEKFFLYYEDVEIGLRAKKANWKCVVIGKARVFHKDTTKTRLFDCKVNLVSIRNQIWVERLYANFLQFCSFILFSFFLRFPLKIFKALITFHFKCAIAIIRGILEGFFSKKLFDGSHFNLPVKKRKVVI